MIGKELTRKHIEDLCAKYAGSGRYTLTDIHGVKYHDFVPIPVVESGMFAAQTYYAPYDKPVSYTGNVCDLYACFISPERIALLFTFTNSTTPTDPDYPIQPRANNPYLTLCQWRPNRGTLETPGTADDGSLIWRYFNFYLKDELTAYLDDYLSKEYGLAKHTTVSRAWGDMHIWATGGKSIIHYGFFCIPFSHLEGGGKL